MMFCIYDLTILNIIVCFMCFVCISSSLQTIVAFNHLNVKSKHWLAAFVGLSQLSLLWYNVPLEM